MTISLPGDFLQNPLKPFQQGILQQTSKAGVWGDLPHSCQQLWNIHKGNPHGHLTHQLPVSTGKADVRNNLLLAEEEKKKEERWLSILKSSHTMEVWVSFSSCFIHTFKRRGKENMYLIKIPGTLPEPMCFADGKT